MVELIYDEGLEADVLAHATQRLGNVGNSAGLPYLLPTTPLFELLEEKQLLKDATQRRKRVDGTTEQPFAIVTTQAVKLTPDMERRVNQNARALGAELDVMMAEVHQRQTYTQEQWETRQRALKRMREPARLVGPGAEYELPVSQRERLRNGAPHAMENTVDLPDGVNLAHFHTPMMTVDVEVLKENYRRNVAEALGLGLAVMQQFTNGGGRAAGAGQNSATTNFAAIFDGQQRVSDTERHLQHVIQTERNWMTTFFSVLYTRIMGSLDMELLDHMNERLRVQQINMREAKLAARAMEQALAREMSLVDDEGVMKAYKATLAASRTKAERRRLKASIVYYRELAEKMRVSSGAAARLVFQPASSDRMARQLQILLEAFYMNGLIEPKVMQPFADAVFGPGIPLKKDAVSPAQRDQVQLAQMKSDSDMQLTKVKGDLDLKRERVKAQLSKKADKGPPKKKARK